MRKYISLIALALFMAELARCFGQPTTSTPRAIDLVQAGKDIAFPGGYVLHVMKREGSSLEGIHIHFPHSGGPADEITADKGTIRSGVEGNIKTGLDGNDFENQITITLYNAKISSGTTNFTSASMKIVLHS